MGGTYFQECDPKILVEHMFRNLTNEYGRKICLRISTRKYGQGGPLNRTGYRGSEVQFEPADPGGRFGDAVAWHGPVDPQIYGTARSILAWEILARPDTENIGTETYAA